jgi:orotidine-5'-phosphate decarboxylase
MTPFLDRLRDAQAHAGACLCVGLDPDADRLPHLLRAAPPPEAFAAFLTDIVRATAPFACAYKPNAAFFEAYGSAGAAALEAAVRAVRRHAPHALVVLDGKRGDIGNTAKAYARWAYDSLEADAVTVNPYMGRDSTEAFFERADRGVFVLARTSNPGAADLQSMKLADGRFVYEHVVGLAKDWNAHGNVGLVAGATYPDELRRIRKLAGPDMLLLIPGVGAQGGSAEHAIRFGGNEWGDNAIVNSSRGILYSPDPAQAAASLRDELNKHRGR